MTSLAHRPENVSVGQVELGRIDIADKVVAKIAAQAAVEIPDAGAAAPRILGRAVSGVGALGIRRTDLQSTPKTSAEVDGSSVRVELTISVRWPHSVPDVCAAVRRNVIERVTQLAGLQITEVRLDVTDLATEIAAAPRVR
ncbi:MAG TPA: Asp23/Gls24 family envelope stress response protein [Acidimicrobiia bacterium]|jgi:uncharacterized alkaline shock family protein YloU